MRSKGSWRRLSKTSSAKLPPKLVQEVRPFIHAHEKINVTTWWALGGRFRDRGVIVSHGALSAVPEQRISFRPDLKGSPIPIPSASRPRLVEPVFAAPPEPPTTPEEVGMTSLLVPGRATFHFSS